MVAGGWMLLAWMMADAGTPWRRAMASMVSPGPTLIALPPSQVQLPLEPGLRTTEPLPSGAPAGAGRAAPGPLLAATRSEEHTSELQSHVNLVCRLLLEKKKKKKKKYKKKKKKKIKKKKKKKKKTK